MEPELEGSTVLSRIFAIASNAFREAVRDRILYNLVIFVLLITAAAIFLGELTAGQEARTIVDLGLNSVLLFGVFISIFVGIGLVSKEIEKRTVYSFFSKPVRRREFIIGKYLGLCLTLIVNIVVMGLGISLALLYVGGTSLIAATWGAIVLIYLELSIITAVAIVFSSFSSPALSALLTFLVFVIGHFSSSLRDLAADLSSRFAKLIFDVVYYVMPNLANFSFASNAAHGDVVPASLFGADLLYAFVVDIVLLAIAVIVFERRNFK
jgi:ABC-type transport system involved in multi-copper enzyme maturation permease subunit